MPQNKTVMQSWTRRSLNAPAVVKGTPGTLLNVVCLAPGTINIINDTSVGGAGASLAGFPATMIAGQLLPVDAPASAGITVKTVTGTYNVVFM